MKGLFFLSFLVLFISLDTLAQNQAISSNRMKAGYIIKKQTGDTLYGLVRKHGFLGMNVKKVDFKWYGGEDKKSYRSDSIVEFGYGDVSYKYFNYCGWSKLILKGIIEVYDGNVKQSILSKSSCMAFIKGNEKVKFINAAEVTGLLITEDSPLNERTKKHFKSYISDNPKLMSELENKRFRYVDLVYLVKRYNEWAKNTPDDLSSFNK